MNKQWLGVLFAAAAVIFTAVVYNRLPEEIPTHFNVAGEADDWASRPVGAFAPLALALGVLLVFHMLPKISPRRRNFEQFEETYWLLANVVIAFICALHVLVIGRALGWPVDIVSSVLIGIGLLFMIMGNFMPRLRSNWWMGIRTPWTMENEKVWRDTHRLAGKTFMIGGAITVIAALLPESVRPWLAIGALGIAGFIPVVYSYVVWRREKAA